MRAPVVDVCVIGAGVVGSAIARALSHHQLTVVLLDAAADVGTGTSKANTAILHTGFDAKPGTLEARLVRRGHTLLTAYGHEVGIPIEPIGALLVAWTAAQRDALPRIAATAVQNGYHRTRPVTVKELYDQEPHLGPHAQGALAIPDEAIVCPFTTPLAFATEALLNDTTIRLGTAVTAVRSDPDGTHHLTTSSGPITARWVVNAAGLHADTIDRLFGHARFTITPRRGELIVYDKLARALVRHVILPVPTATTKGMLVTPSVFGNLLLGPTAEDVADRTATESTAVGLTSLLEHGHRLLPDLAHEEITAVYAGLRAATEHADYQIHIDAGAHYGCVGGIRSTGLTAAMAIAEYVLEGLRDAGLPLIRRDSIHTPRMPNLGEAFVRPYQDAARVAADPAYGQILCHCERVTRGEIRDALAAPLPACSIDGLRRRTRAVLGRCQGFYCLAEVARLVAESTGTPVTHLLGDERP